MTIATYDELLTAIGTALADSTLTDMAPQFVQFAGAMLSRRLNTLDTEGAATDTAAAQMALPADYKGVRSLWLADYPPLKHLGLDDFQKRFAEDTNTGVPEYYAIANGSIYLGPPPDDTYAVTLHYWRKLTPLSVSASTNWLLNAHPDLYLYASLIHAEAHGWNDERVPGFIEYVERTIAEINRADMRARRPALTGDVPGEYF